MKKVDQWRHPRKERARIESKHYHMTPVLRHAGFEVPREMLIREGYIVRKHEPPKAEGEDK